MLLHLLLLLVMLLCIIGICNTGDRYLAIVKGGELDLKREIVVNSSKKEHLTHTSSLYVQYDVIFPLKRLISFK